MSLFSPVSNCLPNFSKYPTEKSAEQCLDKMLDKNEIKNNKKADTVPATAFIEPPEPSTPLIPEKNEEDAFFHTLETALNAHNLQKNSAKTRLKNLLLKGLEKDLSQTLSVLKTIKNPSAIAITLVIKTFKKVPQAASLPENVVAILLKIANSFEAIQTSTCQKKLLKPKEMLSIAILSQHEIPKIQAIWKQLFDGEKEPEKNWIVKKDFQFCHNLLLNPEKKKVYIICEQLLGKGTFKKVLASVGFTTDKDLSLKNPKLYAFAYTKPKHSVENVLRSEKSLALQVRDIPTTVKTSYAEVMSSKDGFFLHMVTELCEGTLEETSHLSPIERVRLAKDVVDSVDALHKKGFIHGDLKTDNFLIKDMRAKLTDFGKARSISLPLNGFKAYGTYCHNSPETLSFQNHAKQTSVTDDAYALGLVLWELTTNSDITNLWDIEIDQFEEFINNHKALPQPKIELLKTLRDRIKTTTEASIKDYLSHADKPEDKALVSVMQIAAQLMQPLESRLTVQQAREALSQIVVA